MKTVLRDKNILKLIAVAVILPVSVLYHTISSIGAAARDVRLLDRKISETTWTVGNDDISPIIVQEYDDILSNGKLVSMLDDKFKNITVVTFSPALLEEMAEAEIRTADITLQGGYIDLVKTLRFLEDLPACKLITTGFSTVRDMRLGIVDLRLNLKLQQIIFKQ